MSNYSKSTNFASKDSLASGNPLKVIKGTEIDDEFENIETSIATKGDLASPTFTGTPAAPTATTGTSSTQIATTAFVDNTMAARTITAGSGLTGGGTLGADRTISHADTSSQASVNNSGNTFIQDITLDTYGHVTGLTSNTVVPLSLSEVYPVGSVYINAGVSTNPSTLFGFGTWVAFGSGRVLVGVDTGDSSFNTLGETGGSKNATLVSHSHTFSGTTSTKSLTGTIHTDDQSTSTGVFNGGVISSSYNSSTGSESPRRIHTLNASHNHTYSGTTSTAGSSATNANLQPYITVYMWKRTA
jgi:hypothetical protein